MTTTTSDLGYVPGYHGAGPLTTVFTTPDFCAVSPLNTSSRNGTASTDVTPSESLLDRHRHTAALEPGVHAAKVSLIIRLQFRFLLARNMSDRLQQGLRLPE